MSQCSLQFITCADSAQGHRLYYRHWKAEATESAKTLVCVHGLTRNSHDFDVLAAALSAQTYQVLCPDMPGRGQSSWLAHPQDYNYNQYLQDLQQLLQTVPDAQVDWIGTSMGGILGMLLAAQENMSIRRLVLNDVGAFLPQAALKRIARYLQHAPSEFSDIQAAEIYFRTIHAPFGKLSDAHWRHLTQYSIQQQPNGVCRLHYDPQIFKAFQTPVQDVSLWAQWKKVRCPTLLLHGMDSDLLLPATIVQMQQTHAALQVVHIADAGHAPSLMDATHIQIIQDFLGAP